MLCEKMFKYYKNSTFEVLILIFTTTFQYLKNYNSTLNPNITSNKNLS